MRQDLNKRLAADLERARADTEEKKRLTLQNRQLRGESNRQRALRKTAGWERDAAEKQRKQVRNIYRNIVFFDIEILISGV